MGLKSSYVKYTIRLCEDSGVTAVKEFWEECAE